MNLTPEEVAADLKVTKGTLRKWRHRGVGPVYHKIGDAQQGHCSYPPEEYLAWKAARVRVRKPYRA